MLYLTIALFAIAAVMGVMNLTHWMGERKPPRAIVYLHGLFAASALVLLVQAMKGEGAALRTSLIFFIIAALGGFYLFARDLQNKIGPGWLAMIHGLVAAIGFILLLLVAF